MKYASSRLQLNTGCQHVKHGPRTILLKLLTILLSGSPFRWWTRQQVTAGLIPQQSLLRRLTLHVQLLSKAINVKIVELAGTNQFQMFATVSIKKFPRGISDQVISCGIGRRPSTGRAPDPGLKKSIWFFQDHCWKQRHNPNFKPQASSVKHQAPIFRKLSNQPVQALGDKRQAPGSKRQAPSHKRQAP